VALVRQMACSVDGAHARQRVGRRYLRLSALWPNKPMKLAVTFGARSLSEIVRFVLANVSFGVCRSKWRIAALGRSATV
jgi:hypothetical protein